MGGGIGKGMFKGKYNSSINNNLGKLKKKYPISDSGYFGKKGESSSSYVRNIISKNPLTTAKDFYKKASEGGKETFLNNGKGVTSILADGTRITYREISSSDGSSVVEIIINNPCFVKSQKIHFIKDE